MGWNPPVDFVIDMPQAWLKWQLMASQQRNEPSGNSYLHIIFQNWVVEMLEEIISKQTDLSLGGSYNKRAVAGKALQTCLWGFIGLLAYLTEGSIANF